MSANDPQLVCVSTQPIGHHTPHGPGDCYCDVWCRHGRMECAECPGFVVEECPDCGSSSGPWPQGDRPKPTAPIGSGCPTCGACL